MKIAIVVSRFNEDVTELLLQGALEHFRKKRGLTPENGAIEIARVPGAVELPLIAQRFARRGDCSAVICLGAVIRGETGHYEYVCQQVSYGCQRVALDFDIPVIFGVLTTENKAQALARVGGAHGHKGKEAADAALTMVALIKEVGHVSHFVAT